MKPILKTSPLAAKLPFMGYPRKVRVHEWSGKEARMMDMQVVTLPRSRWERFKSWVRAFFGKEAA